MSEKERFVVGSNEIGEIIVTDVETGKVYDNLYKFFGLIRLMNEQQARIKELEKENEQLQRENNLLNNNEDDLKECTLENIQLKEENQELKRLIKKMGELGGFNKHLIKTICEDLE